MDVYGRDISNLRWKKPHNFLGSPAEAQIAGPQDGRPLAHGNPAPAFRGVLAPIRGELDVVHQNVHWF